MVSHLSNFTNRSLWPVKGTSLYLSLIIKGLLGDGLHFHPVKPLPLPQNKVGAEKCEACPAGTFSQQGSGYCVKCPAGSYTDKEGQGQCYLCPAGSFNDDEGSCVLI